MADSNGTILYSWAFPEYEPYARGRGWYVGAAVVGLALLAYAFATRNFLFAVLVVMFAVILYLRVVRAPSQRTCALTERGVTVGDRFTPYEQFEAFWIVDDAGPNGTLYLDARGLRPRLVVPLADRDAAAIRQALRAHLPERGGEEEPAADAIGRVLKL